jgi:hypothetical protein
MLIMVYILCYLTIISFRNLKLSRHVKS